LSDYRRDGFGGIAVQEGPGKAVAGILFPVPVAGQFGDGAKARLAFARPFARLLRRGPVVAFLSGAGGLSHASGHCRPAPTARPNASPGSALRAWRDKGLRPRRVSPGRSEEHTSELQSRGHLVCRLLLEKKKKY